MADKEWIENLASASFADQEWQLAYPDRAQKLVELRQERALEELYDEAIDATTIFNRHAPRGREISVVSQTRESGGSSFLLAMASFQISVESDQGSVKAFLWSRAGFEVQKGLVFDFQPSFDVFGDLRWSAKNYPLCDYETMIKLILEVLCREVSLNRL